MHKKPEVNWHRIEWRPEHHDGILTAEEFVKLQEQVSRFYSIIAGQPQSEHPDFSIWFGDRQLTISGK